ncbi:IS861 transposase [Streptococcus sanguinis SK1059]|uniref:IS861 transposase n=3 Tax=Streptococcus sanguinis TaxID=1305 RepID=F0ITQ1_STRSA|nr:IS861 transposase [Streptococcus sanguinis SK160]EGF14587.1 IS861 transposase [Streptococcus sanguinis SK330]EGJ41705.1 IS861 transposase [Streptococcus sanguinis SK355]EGJ43921.1 IS861 transposase [Streptococcus sanguinis SK1059]EGQ19797.1 IS861 transposase [Streptococcus sanguinis ATCC 29667]EGQ23643.1 IS861 transposase [Streptococcus sanguinis SK340]
MKLTYEDKVRIYELRKQGISLKRLSEKYEMNLSKLLTSNLFLNLYLLQHKP